MLVTQLETTAYVAMTAAIIAARQLQNNSLPVDNVKAQVSVHVILISQAKQSFAQPFKVPICMTDTARKSCGQASFCICSFEFV